MYASREGGNMPYRQEIAEPLLRQMCMLVSMFPTGKQGRTTSSSCADVRFPNETYHRIGNFPGKGQSAGTGYR